MFLKVLLTSAVFINLTLKRELAYAQAQNEDIHVQIWPSSKPYPFLTRIANESLNLTCGIVNDTDLVPGEKYSLLWRIPFNLINSNRTVPFKLSNGIIGLQFNSLQEIDSGNYTCLSNIINKKVTTRLVVKPGVNRTARKAYCGDRMFVCPDGLCILERFVCDGRADCPLGADERAEYCGENVCLGKIQCNDGRCIPSEWCCRQRDVNCTTRVRPDCCDEVPQEVYQEYEGSYLSKQYSKKTNDMDFLHMTIYTIIACALALTIIVLLLVMMLCKAHFHDPHCCNIYNRHDENNRQEQAPTYSSAFNLSQLLSRYDRVPFQDQEINNQNCDMTAYNMINRNRSSIHRNNNRNIVNRVLMNLCGVSLRQGDTSRNHFEAMNVDYNINNGTTVLLGETILNQPRYFGEDFQNIDNVNHEFIGQPVSPPPYSETLQIPPKIGPPPPYVSVEDLILVHGGNSNNANNDNDNELKNFCSTTRDLNQPSTSGTICQNVNNNNNNFDDILYIDCDSENDSCQNVERMLCQRNNGVVRKMQKNNEFSKIQDSVLEEHDENGNRNSRFLEISTDLKMSFDRTAARNDVRNKLTDLRCTSRHSLGDLSPTEVDCVQRFSRNLAKSENYLMQL